jgi:hypothetical protein
MGGEFMRIRWKIAVSGMVHGRVNGVKPGDIMDLPEREALRYLKLHYAEPVVTKDEERAVAPKGEERAVANEGEEPIRRGRPPKTAS